MQEKSAVLIVILFLLFCSCGGSSATIPDPPDNACTVNYYETYPIGNDIRPLDFLIRTEDWDSPCVLYVDAAYSEVYSDCETCFQCTVCHSVLGGYKPFSDGPCTRDNYPLIGDECYSRIEHQGDLPLIYVKSEECYYKMSRWTRDGIGCGFCHSVMTGE